jgi:hypothetical protein
MSEYYRYASQTPNRRNPYDSPPSTYNNNRAHGHHSPQWRNGPDPSNDLASKLRELGEKADALHYHMKHDFQKLLDDVKALMAKIEQAAEQAERHRTTTS